MPSPSRPQRLKLEELLLRHGAISKEQLETAQKEQKKWGGEIGRIMVDQGFISEQLLMKALAHEHGFPTADPANDPLSEDIVRALGVQLCERFGVIAVAGDLDRKILRVATSDPTNSADLRTIAGICGYRVEPAAATLDSVNKAIRKYYYGEGAAEQKRFEKEMVEGMADALRRSPGPSEEAARPARRQATAGDLDVVFARLERLEQLVRPLKEQIAELITNPHFAAITGRLELVEQVANTEVHALRATVELLIEKGLLRKEEYLSRLRAKKSGA